MSAVGFGMISWTETLVPRTLTVLGVVSGALLIPVVPHTDGLSESGRLLRA